MIPSAKPPQAAAGEPPREKEKEPSWKKQLVIGAALALIGAVIGRAVGVIPNPFSPTPTPEESGSIQIGETLRNQTRAMFRGKNTPPQPTDQFGLTLAVQRVSQNTSPHSCRIVWTYIDPTVPTTVSDQTLVDQTARDVDGDPTACQGGARIWVPLKPTLEAYNVLRVRVELFSGDKQLGIPDETEDIGL